MPSLTLVDVLDFGVEAVNGGYFEMVDLQTSKSLEFAIGLLDSRLLSRAPHLLRQMHCLLNYFLNKSAYVKPLMELGLIERLRDILNSLLEGEHRTTTPNEYELKNYVALVCLDVFPALPQWSCFQEVDRITFRGLVKGRRAEETQENKNEIINSLRMFCSVYNSCLQTDIIPAYLMLLLKMIYWANELDLLTQLVNIEEIINLVKLMLCHGNHFCVLVGLSIIRTLITKHVKDFEGKFNETEGHVRTLFRYGTPQWVEDVYAMLAPSDDITLNMFTYYLRQVSERNHTQSDLIGPMLNYIIPSFGDSDENSNSVSLNYSRLRKFIQGILNLPKDAGRHRGRLTVQADGIQMFRILVSYVVEALNNIGVENFFHQEIRDMPMVKGVKVSSPAGINLGLFTSDSLDRVLGPSHASKWNDCLIQALRLISIFYEVNENWGILFCTLTTERLIDPIFFTSPRLEHDIDSNTFNDIKSERDKLSVLFDNALQYPFLLPYGARKEIMLDALMFDLDITGAKVNEVPIKVSRSNIIDSLIQNRYVFENQTKNIWSFEFEGEIGTGDGPNKEFYTEFSLECQKYDLGLWIGEAVENSNGIAYSYSSCGLFPSAKSCSALRKLSPLKSRAMGIIIGRSLLEDRQLDLNFSTALFKYLFKSHPHNQSLTLVDFKEVMPNIYEFISDLVDALRNKRCIETNESLTAEERKMLVANLGCSGCSFEDLCVTFNIPGFPDMELKKGGSDVLLTIDNVEEYLQLLVWFVLYKGPQKFLGKVRNGFRELINGDYMHLFSPQELEQLFCGVEMEEWTVDYLQENCVLDEGLSEDSPVGQYVFEVLSSLSASEKLKFLKFVTSSTRLPCGGLGELSPRLTIIHNFVEDPDQYLPTSSTCFNTLFVTDYSNKEILREKLLLAFDEGLTSFQLP